MKHLDELERQIISGQPLDASRLAQLQMLDVLTLNNQFVEDSLSRQRLADDLILRPTSEPPLPEGDTNERSG